MTIALAAIDAVLAALPDQPTPMISAFSQAAAALVEPAALGVPVSEDGWAGVGESLALRWADTAGSVLDHELGWAHGPLSGLLELPTCRADWALRLERYPGLVTALDQLSERWRIATRELFTRLAADRPALFAVDPGPLTRFRGDLGDRHAGRSTTILSFGADSVVYKPKDMRHAQVFQDLLAWLSGRLPLPLASHRVVCGDGYGWEELIEAAPCSAEAGFGRYYRRLGMLARLVQFLDGRDMWADNLIAAGDQPVLIDVECMLVPLLPHQSPGALSDLVAASVILGGVVCMPWNVPGDQEIVDVSCLSRAGTLRAADGTPAMPLPPYLPSTTAGVIADPWRYHAEVTQGYEEMNTALVAAAPDLPARLAPLRTARIRVIRRNTWDYYAMLRASLSPRILAEPGAREREIAALHAAATRRGRPDLMALAEAEAIALGGGDIPLFASFVGSTAIVSDNGMRIDDFYATTAWDRLADRIAGLRDFPIDDHTDILSACLEVAREATETGPVPAAEHPGHEAPPGDRLAGAIEIGQLMLNRWREGWFGLSWFPVSGLRMVGVLAPDLVGGAAGIAVFLGELAAATGDDRYRQRCRQVLLDAGAALLSAPEPELDRRVARRVPVPGGLFGPGAVLYALARCGHLLADTELLDLAGDLVEVAGSLATSRSAAGLLTGRAGLLANLLRLRRARPGQPGPDPLIRELTAGAVTDLARGPAPASPAARRRAARLPADADGLALALAYALRWTPDLVPDPHAATALLRQHSFAADWGGRLAAAAVTRQPPSAPAWNSMTATCRDLVIAAAELLLAGDDCAAPVGELLARRRASGRWYSDRVIADHLNLGAIDGLADVGLVLLGAPPVSVLQ